MNFTSDFLLVLIFKGSWEPQCPGAPGAPGAPNHELELCPTLLKNIDIDIDIDMAILKNFAKYRID